jgi:tetratricopeptide (TPR) repeat protein
MHGLSHSFMRTPFIALAVTFTLLASTATAQTAVRPTKKPAASTPDQDAALRAGVALNDQGKFDEAIAKYQEVLKESPDNVVALYELAYSYGEKKDYANSLETARRGIAYDSELLAMFYDLIGSSLDSSGQPQQAIDAYAEGIRVVADAGMLYHNMAITYLESLKNPEQARKTLERGALADPTESAIPLMLAQVFKDGGYTTPAFFAYSTYLLLEPAGPRSLQAYGNWRAILKGGVEAPIGGAQAGADPATDAAMMRTAPKPAVKTDEGDFSDLDAQLPLGQRALLAELDNGATEMQALVTQVNRLLLFLSGRPLGKDRTTFTGTLYLPFFRELKQRNFVEPYVYWVSQRAPIQGIREWMRANDAKMREFLDWARQYPWPKG